MKKEIRPAKGSLMVLKTNSESGSESLILRVGGFAVVRSGSGAHGGALGCGGHVIHDEVEHLVGADVAQSGGEHYGENLVFANGVVQPANNMFLADGALVEELFHEHVVAFGDQFHQALVRGFGLLRHVLGNGADGGFAVATHFVGVGMHLHQVDDAGETLLRADGQLHRDDGAAEGGGQRLHHAVEVGAVAVHAGADDHARKGKLIAIIPDTLGDDLDAADGIHDH